MIDLLAHIFGGLFGACILFLETLSSVTGMTYKATCTLINLYVQGGIIAFLPLFTLGCAVANKRLPRRKVWIAATAVYCGVNLLVYLGIFLHYGLDMDAAYDKCFSELMAMSGWMASLGLYDFSSLSLSFLGKQVPLTDTYVWYGLINLAFFVVAFLLTIVFDLWAGVRLLRKNRIRK